MKPTETLNVALFLKQALVMDPKTMGRLPAGLSDSMSSRLPGQSLLSRYKELLTGSRSKSLRGLTEQVRANMDKLPAAVRERVMGSFTSPFDTALKNEKGKVLATRVGTGLGAAALGGGVALASKKKKSKDKIPEGGSFAEMTDAEAEKLRAQGYPVTMLDPESDEVKNYWKERSKTLRR